MTIDRARLLNFVERVLWTLLQVISAEGLLTFWEKVITHHEQADRGLWLIILTTLLAAVKNAAAQAFGSPTGATLPAGTAQPTAVAKADPASPTSESAGPASTLPDDQPTVTLPADPAQWGEPLTADDLKRHVGNPLDDQDGHA